MPTQRHIVVFSRFPEPGRAKTRLIPALGDDGAARLQRSMSGRAVLTARVAAHRAAATLTVYHTDTRPRRMRRWLGDGTAYRPQSAGDLGARMRTAFDGSFAAGSRATLIVGTDCPALTPDILLEGLAALETHDVVFGPADDGGYYLIGLRRPAPELFTGIDWGTETVLRQSLAAIDNRDLAIKWLPPLADVDRPDDLPHWEAIRPAPPAPPAAGSEPAIAVIVPARNEAATIGRAIENVRSEADAVIVVDGQSRDETAAIAAARGARVLSVPPGRAGQMNAGALAAEQEILLFLHADTRLPNSFGADVRGVLRRADCVAGAFALGIDGHGAGLRFVEAGANLRSRWLQMPYGDQGLFVSRAVFHELGGFGELPIMEDFDLARRLRREGRIVTLPRAARTSARRWRRLGTWRTTVLNQRVILGYLLGRSPTALSQQYRNIKPSEES